MLNIIEALELFEISADEMAAEDAIGVGCVVGHNGRRLSLTARALAKRQLDGAHLARIPLRGSSYRVAADEPAMTLGAVIVFRTADRFVRAGASTSRTLDAVYRAAQRYLDLIPRSLLDGVDRAAFTSLMAESAQSTRLHRSPRSSGMVERTGIVRRAAARPGESRDGLDADTSLASRSASTTSARPGVAAV
jgi:hypothetical protein